MLGVAIGLHQQGQFAPAGAIYQDILRREKEAAGDFGGEFNELARSVYLQNDRRAAIKREINLALGSDLMEEKSYGGPRPA